MKEEQRNKFEVIIIMYVKKHQAVIHLCVNFQKIIDFYLMKEKHQLSFLEPARREQKHTESLASFIIIGT